MMEFATRSTWLESALSVMTKRDTSRKSALSSLINPSHNKPATAGKGGRDLIPDNRAEMDAHGLSGISQALMYSPSNPAVHHRTLVQSDINAICCSCHTYRVLL